MEELIDWTNKNSGFLSLVLFVITILYGWFSGLFSSLIKKPKLKIRFIKKMTFYSFFFTGEKWFNNELNEEFDLHKTGFVVYMSIANIGNKSTTIDKIWLGYNKNTNKKKWFKKEFQWVTQWHSVDNFRLEMTNGSEIEINNLRIRNSAFDNKDNDSLDVGKSLVGVAYFEQRTAWGNLNPNSKKDGKIDIIIKIQDIYGSTYKFKTELNQISIEEARKFNQHFGNIEELTAK